MAWTAPRTWTAGETVTSSLMNTHVRDNLTFLKTEVDSAVVSLFSYADGTGVGNTAATETVLQSTTIAANTLDADTEALDVFAAGITANTGSTDKRIRLRLGTTTLTGTALFDTAGKTVQNEVWRLRVLVTRTGSAAQLAIGDCGFINTSEALNPIVQNQVAGTEDWTVANLLEVTGNGTNGSDVVLRQMLVRHARFA